jgi:hypothetical protein
MKSLLDGEVTTIGTDWIMWAMEEDRLIGMVPILG